MVSVAGVTGTVEDFSLRRTTLRDLDGVVHTVPNGEIKVASNRTRTWARINQNVVVLFGTDVDKAIDVVNAVGQGMADDPKWKRRILEPPRVDRVESIDPTVGITLKILGTVRASDQWEASGEFRRKLLTAFAETASRSRAARRAPGPGRRRRPPPARPRRSWSPASDARRVLQLWPNSRRRTLSGGLAASPCATMRGRHARANA